MKKFLFAIALTLLFAACGDSSSSSEPEAKLAKGDSIEILKSQKDDGDLRTVWVKDDSGEKARYDVEEVLTDGKKYLLVNSDTKDTVVAKISGDQMVVVEVREYDPDSDSDDDDGSGKSSKGNSSAKSSSSRTSSSEKSCSSNGDDDSSSSFSFVIENDEMKLDLNVMKVTDKRDGHVYDVNVDSMGYANMFQPLNYAIEDSSWCYNNYPENCERYGRLYTFYSAFRGRTQACGGGYGKSVCPEGWDVDWNGVEGYYGGFRYDDGAFSGIGGTQIYWSMKSSHTFTANTVGNCSKDNANVTEFCRDGGYCENLLTSNSVPFMKKKYAASVHCSYNYLIDPPEGVELPKSTYVVPKFEMPDITQEYSGPYGELIDDRDGNIYKIVEIGSQTWMSENLRYAIDSSFCIDRDCGANEHYGRFYRYEYAIGLDGNSYSTDTLSLPIQGVCPDGWHIPAREEWETLFAYVLERTDGLYIKKTLMTTGRWGDVEHAGYNTFGFNLKASGWLYHYHGTIDNAKHFGNPEGNSNVEYMMSDEPSKLVYIPAPDDAKELYYYPGSYFSTDYPLVRCVKGDGNYGIHPPKPEKEDEGDDSGNDDGEKADSGDEGEVDSGNDDVGNDDGEKDDSGNEGEGDSENDDGKNEDETIDEES